MGFLKIFLSFTQTTIKQFQTIKHKLFESFHSDQRHSLIAKYSTSSINA